MHAQMWRERLAGEPRFEDALDELWPYAIAMSTEADWGKLSPRLQRETPSNSLLQGLERGAHTRDWPRLWEEMTEVRRSVPGATW
jgi:1,2-phenylacetyl-CoA epoxidase catalytic subunit